MFWLELALLLLMLFFGARRGGLFLGMIGGIGMVVLVFGLHMTPAAPPTDVILIVATVTLASATMQCAGGVEYMVDLSEKMMRRNPRRITLLAPLIVYVVCFFSGTGYACFSLLPVIAEVARETGIRPERPLSISVIASQQAGYSSPICAAMAVMIGLFAPSGVHLAAILLVCVPASLLGLVAGAFYAGRMGPELDSDPEYLERLKRGEAAPPATAAHAAKSFDSKAKLSTLIFVAGAATVILLAAMPTLRPVLLYAGKPAVLRVPECIEMVMMTTAALIVLACAVKVGRITEMQIYKAGMMGILLVFGVAWMSQTVVDANTVLIKNAVQTAVAAHPWTFLLAICAIDILTASQAVTVAAAMPIGLALGLPTATLIGMFPACTLHFFLPVNTAQLTAIALDTTHTTKVGRYVLDHSFMVPGLVTLAVTLCVSTLLATQVL